MFAGEIDGRERLGTVGGPTSEPVVAEHDDGVVAVGDAPAEHDVVAASAGIAGWLPPVVAGVAGEQEWAVAGHDEEPARRGDEGGAAHVLVHHVGQLGPRGSAIVGARRGEVAGEEDPVAESHARKRRVGGDRLPGHPVAAALDRAWCSPAEGGHEPTVAVGDASCRADRMVAVGLAVVLPTASALVRRLIGDPALPAVTRDGGAGEMALRHKHARFTGASPSHSPGAAAARFSAAPRRARAARCSGRPAATVATRTGVWSTIVGAADRGDQEGDGSERWRHACSGRDGARSVPLQVRALTSGM